MYTDNYGFYDIYALLVFFRNFPDKFSYVSALESLICFLDTADTGIGFDNNNIRFLLQPFMDKNDVPWVFVENYYTANIYIMKNSSHYAILSAVLKELVSALKEHNVQKVYLAADAVHNIPLLLTDPPKTSGYIHSTVNRYKLKKAIRKMIKQYQDTYNSDFLLKELETLT